MQTVLTLVGPAGQPLDDAALEACRHVLPADTVFTSKLDHVAEAVFECDDLAAARQSISAALTDHPIDFCVQPTAFRNKKLLIADMDSTMITVECIDELADFAGVGAHVADITERAMRGEIDFESALIERVGLLKGLPESTLAACYDARVTLTQGARDLIQSARRAGIYCALVSGGFTYFTNRVAEVCGFQENRANGLIFENGQLTGNVARPILGREAKVQALTEICAQLGVSPNLAVAIGDGANDIGMIEAAGLGIAFHAKPVTRNTADCSVNYGSLEVVKHYLGL